MLEADFLVIPDSELHFDYVRSSGPGGQNVNKVSSKAVLRWNVGQSPSLPPEVRKRFFDRFANRINKEGELVLSSDEYRDQARNAWQCLEKLKEMLISVARPPKKRKKTKPTKSSQRKRVATKRVHSEKKAGRRGGSWD